MKKDRSIIDQVFSSYPIQALLASKASLKSNTEVSRTVFQPEEKKDTDKNRDCRCIARVTQKANQYSEAAVKKTQEMISSGLFCCPKRSEFGQPYTFTALSKQRLYQHSNGKWSWRSESSLSKVVYLAASTSEITCSNMTKVLISITVTTQSPFPTKATNDALCIRKFPPTGRKVPNLKTKELKRHLEEMFVRGVVGKSDKLSPRRMHGKMKSKENPNGTPFNSFSKRLKVPDPGKSKKCLLCSEAHSSCRCNGRLITIEEIIGWVSSRTQKGKEGKKDKGKRGAPARRGRGDREDETRFIFYFEPV